MSIYLSGPTHKANWGRKVVASATDASDGFVQVSFQATYALAYSVMVTDSSNNVIALTGAVITHPATGSIRITSGGAFTVTDGYIIHVTAQADNSIYDYS